MELIAKKTFRVHNGRRVKKGERFTTNDVMGRIYLYAKSAEHPPRVLTPEQPKAEKVEIPVTLGEPEISWDGEPWGRDALYQTRVMTADVDKPIVPRRRGRPRKNVDVVPDGTELDRDSEK